MAQGASPAPNDAAAAAAEVRRIAALENCCTTLCLWEPDARLMIRKAKGQERARKSEQQASTPEGAASQLAARLCAFLQARAGRCSSQQLVAHFKADCSNPALFKEVLKQVATKDDGAWVLKEDFENGS